jgi:sugar phosphate permease
MGIKGIGERFGSALLPLMVQFLILLLGWRMAWGVLGGVIFLMSGIPALILLRHRPEDMGLLPDGDGPFPERRQAEVPACESAGGKAAVQAEPVWTRAQATQTSTFWMLGFVSCMIPFIQAGINFHIYPFLTDQGFSEAKAVFALTTFAVSGMVGSLFWGMLSERFRNRDVMTFNLVGSGLIFLALYWAVLFRIPDPLGTAVFFLLAALHGLFHGGRNPLLSIIWANFYGRRSLGSVYSLINPFFFTANAIGPIFAGLCFDLWKSYTFPFYLFTASFFLSGMVSMRMRPPVHPGAAPDGGSPHGK